MTPSFHPNSIFSSPAPTPAAPCSKQAAAAPSGGGEPERWWRSPSGGGGRRTCARRGSEQRSSLDGLGGHVMGLAGSSRVFLF